MLCLLLIALSWRSTSMSCSCAGKMQVVLGGCLPLVPPCSWGCPWSESSLPKGPREVRLCKQILNVPVRQGTGKFIWWFNRLFSPSLLLHHTLGVYTHLLALMPVICQDDCPIHWKTYCLTPRNLHSKACGLRLQKIWLQKILIVRYSILPSLVVNSNNHSNWMLYSSVIRGMFLNHTIKP